MPCYTIQRSKVAFLPESTDEGMLAKAMEALGLQAWQWQFNRADGKLTLPQSVKVDAVKRGYSKQVVQSQAAKFGWQIKWTVNAAGNDEAAVARRA